LYSEAIRWGRQGLAQSRRTGDRRQLAYAHSMLANPYADLGSLKQAVRHLRSAVRLYDEAGDLPGVAVSNNNLGACYQLLGNLDEARRHYETSLKARERMGNVIDAAMVHNNIGEVLLTQGHLSEAVRRFRRVVETYEKTGEPLGVSGLALVNLSRAYQRQRHHETAVECVERGKELLRKAGARGPLVEAILQHAELELEAGEVGSAARTCRRALRQSSELGAKLLEARGVRILGRIALARGDRTVAEDNLKRSVALAERLGADYERGLSLLYLAELYDSEPKKTGFRRRSWLARKQAVAILRRLGANVNETQSTGTHAKELSRV
jgi:tetratricopeptide (TPR) repeat protein